MRPAAYRPWAAFVVLTVGTLSFSCEKPQACSGVHVGDKFSISVVDAFVPPNQTVLYEAGEFQPCEFGFDISQGQTITVADVDDSIDTTAGCTAATVSVDSFNGWQWSLTSSRSPNSEFILSGDYDATNGSCHGDTQMNVQVTEGTNPFVTFVPGQMPSVIMTRLFSGTCNGAQKNCDGSFIVNLKKL